MGPFLETLFGGLMVGMLYSLIAIGFVLIYKASGVFNFAQGAMVLFAALAMARFAEWFPRWFGFESQDVGQPFAGQARPLRDPFGKARHRQCREQHHRALREVEDARGLEDQHEAERDERIQLSLIHI